MALTATAGGQPFSLLGVNPDGTANWQRGGNDPYTFNNISQNVAQQYGLSGNAFDYAYRNPLAGRTFYDIQGNALPFGSNVNKTHDGSYNLMQDGRSLGRAYESPEQAAYWNQRATSAANSDFVTGAGPQGRPQMPTGIDPQQAQQAAQQNMAQQNEWIASQNTIPVQQPGQFTGMDVSGYQGGLLGNQQQQQGLLGFRPNYPVYGEPNQVRYPNGFGLSQRPWLTAGTQQATGQINDYLQSQRNPDPLPAPASIKSFDDWRQGILAKPELALDAEKIMDALIQAEVEKYQNRNGLNGTDEFSITNSGQGDN